MIKNNQRGFTLIELLIVTGLLAVVTGGVLKLLYQGQQTFQSQTQINRSTEQARIAMDQMVRYLRHAGNDPFDYMKENDIPATQIVSAGELRINSDVTGSVASSTSDARESTGDPDGDLGSIHEQVRFRFDAATKRVFVDIGYGETVVASGISDLQFEYLDVAGNTTANSDEVAAVRITLIAVTSNSRIGDGEDRVTLQSDVFLRSKTFNPFESD